MTKVLNLCILLIMGAQFGIALTATAIIHPILLQTKRESALEFFKPFFNKTHKWVLILSITVTILTLIYSLQTSNWNWFILSLFMHLNGPYTVLFMMPLNKRLLQSGVDVLSEQTSQDLKNWGKLHLLRTLLNGLIFLGFIGLSIYLY